MKFIYDDGGQVDAGFKGTTGDCVCRAIAIATQRLYKEVYDLINEYGKQERTGKRKNGRSSAQTGDTEFSFRKKLFYTRKLLTTDVYGDIREINSQSKV